MLNDRIRLLEPDLEQSSMVHRGQRFHCRTMDASGNQINEGTLRADIRTDKLFPVNGPIKVEGVVPGTAVGIRVHSVDPDQWGHAWTRAELGMAAPVDFHVRRLSTMAPSIDWGDAPGVVVPSRVHIGTIGLLPNHIAEPRTLGAYGGNMDFVGIASGATVWITAQVAGAGLFLGDVHAAMGDAEVCGSGIEVAADVALSVQTRSDWAPTHPTVVSRGRTWLVCDGDSFEDALKAGVKECTALLSERWNMTVADAYLAVGLLLQVRVCQVVNPRVSVAISLSGGADTAFLPRTVLPEW